MSLAVPLNMQLVTSLGAAGIALAVIGIRLKASKKPTSIKKIIMPPLGMTTGFCMFFAPQTHIPWLYVLLSVLVGFLFSYPLIQTSKFEVVTGDIYLKRSRAFPLILLSLLALRLGLHSYVEELITVPQTGAVFFVLAYAMLLPWRVAMYVRYKKLENSQIKPR